MNTPQPERDLLTREEAAELLRQSPDTLRYWATVGKGPKHFRVGGRRVLYKRSDVLDWLDGFYQNAS